MRRFAFLLPLGILALAIAPVIVHASDITHAIYVGTVRVHNDNVTAAAVSTNMTLLTQNLIDRGYMLSDATNTDLRTQLGFDTPYMPAPGNTNAWAIWVPSINGYTMLDYKLYTGGATNMASKLAYFPGAGGMTSTDNASMELGNNFAFYWYGYLQTGTSDNLCDKPSAFRVYTGSGNLTAEIFGTAANVTVAIPAAENVWKVWADTVNLYIGEATDTPPPPSSESHLAIGFAAPSSELNVGFATSGNSTHVLLGGFTSTDQFAILGQVPLGGATVPNTSSNWTFTRAGAMPYLYYQKLEVGGSLVQDIRWQNNATTFTNSALVGNDATPTFRTTSSNSYVWAELLDFGPIDTATSDGGGGSQPPDIAGAPNEPGGMYTELSVTFVGSDFINGLLDAAQIPRALFWFPLFMLIIMLLSFIIYYGTHSTVMKAVMLWLMFMMVAALGGWGWWILIPLAIEMWAAVQAMKKVSW